MTTLETDLHVLRQAGEVMFVSLEAIVAEDWDEHDWRDHAQPLQIELERYAIPVVPATVEMWEGDDGTSVALYPHLHWACPRCQQRQNVDLDDGDTNPQFGFCWYCRWDSPVWLAWPAVPVV